MVPSIGPYEVQGELGRGGMGVVLRGRAPDGRTVAIKVMLDARAKDAAQRFDRERRLQGSLGEADGFVPMLDGGVSPQGPYLVMPYLAGGTLSERMKQGPLAVPEVVALARSLGAALGRAHTRGIVHRDLKPDNVLFGDAGRPLIADLGLAKHYRDDVAGASMSVSLSKDGGGRGTLGYMPPEQAFGAKTVGPTADVFALGVILHEALTGKRLFEGESVHAAIGRVVSGQLPAPRAARSTVPGWLSDLVMAALEGEPERRPADGAAFVAALDRAEAAGEADREGRRQLAIASVVAALLFGAAGAVILTAGPPAGAPGAAPPPTTTTPPPAPPAPTAPTAPPGPVAPARRAPSETALGLSVEDPELRRLCESFLDTPRLHLAAVLGDPAWRLRDGVRALALLPGEAQALVGGQDGGLMLFDLRTGRGLHSLVGHGLEDDVLCVDVSPDGQLGLSGAQDDRVCLWSLGDDGAPAVLDTEPHAGDVTACAFSPDGAMAASAGADRVVHLWRIERTGAGARLEELRQLVGHRAVVNCVTFAPDGRLLVSGSSDRTLGVWDVASGARRSTLTNHTGPVKGVAFLPRERPAALSVGDDGLLCLWDLERAACVTSATLSRPAHCVAVAPDGETAIVGQPEGWLASIDLARMEERWAKRGHWNDVYAARFTKDGRRLITGSRDTNVKLWDPARGDELAATRSLAGHRDWVRGVSFSQDGARLLTASDDEDALLWELPRPGQPAAVLQRLEGHEGRVQDVSFVLEDQAAVTVSDDESVRLWDLATGAELASLAGHTEPLQALAVDREGRIAASAGRDKVIRVWDLQGRGEAWTIPGSKDWVNGLAFLPGRRVLAVGDDDDLVVWNPGGAELRRMKVGKSNATAVAVSPDGRRALTGDLDGRVLLWDLAAGAPLLALDGHRARISGLAFTPDGGRAVSTARDMTLRVWDLSRAPAAPAGGGEPARGLELDRVELTSASDYPLSVALSPDGKTIVAGTGRGLVLWFAFKEP